MVAAVGRFGHLNCSVSAILFLNPVPQISPNCALRSSLV